MNGIVAARDAAGNVYYVDPATGATSWSIAALSGEHDIVGAQDARGRTYFVNLRTQATAWTRDELLDEKLPEGVVSTVDMSSGNVYYIHEASGRTAWHLDDVINEGGETFTSSKTPTTCEEVINEGADLSTPKTTTCDDVIHEGSEPSTSKTTTTACDDDAIEDGSKPSKSTNTMKTCVDVMDESSKLSIPKTTATCVVGKWPPDLPESCCFDNFEGRRLRYRGILLKKGHGDSLLGRRRWQHRWFVLNGAQLEYYGDAQFKTWKGRVKLRAESRVETGGGKKFKGRAKGLDASEANYFAITMTVDARTNAPIDGALQLRAKTNVEMDEWLESLNLCIAILADKARTLQQRHAHEDSTSHEGQHQPSFELPPPPPSSREPSPSPPTQQVLPPSLLPQTQASPSPPSSLPLTQSDGAPRLSKYEKMLKCGLPQGAVEQKMRVERIDPTLLFGSDANLRTMPEGIERSQTQAGAKTTYTNERPATSSGQGDLLLSAIQQGAKLKRSQQREKKGARQEGGAPRPPVGRGPDLQAAIKASSTRRAGAA